MTSGLSTNGILSVALEKPSEYRMLFTKGNAFDWSFQEFSDEVIAEYSDQGSTKYGLDVNCHKAFLDAVEEAINDGKCNRQSVKFQF